MIEALSTMLDAAVGRDGRSQAPLSEELKYVDAYLYITKERLGERLTVSREIEKSMLGCQIPRLMHSSNTNLQPESIFSHCRFNLLGDANSKAQPAQIERCNKGMADSLSVGHISPRSE